MTAFSFLVSNNASLSSDVTAAINGTNIVFDIPYGADISSLVATFTTSGVSVTVSGAVQASGTTVNNFSSFLKYKVTAEDASTKDYTAMLSSIFSIGPIAFVLTYVPGDLTFPTSNEDALTATVTNQYQVARTEVTYKLWYAERSWALAHGYTFANAGREGNDGTDSAAPTSANQEPVTQINWRDAMVWTNALTEYNNDQNGTSFTCAYHSNASFTNPIRDSSDGAFGASLDPLAGGFDDPYVKPDATGFRLLTVQEWELAARYIKDDGDNALNQAGEYYLGYSASGADIKYDALSGSADFDGDCDVEGTKDVAVYLGNSGFSTATVKTKSPNALGLYDVSGNAAEWVFDSVPSGSARQYRGGNWNLSSDAVQVGEVSGGPPYVENNLVGLRFSRTP